jgi:hypothetical protein
VIRVYFKILLFISFALVGCICYGQEIRSNKKWDQQIQSIRLYPDYQTETQQLYPPVVPLEAQNLILEFDDLRNDHENYYVRLLYCNFDWTASRLHDLDFMTSYNEFNITDYSYSSNTHIPYVHYRFELPQVKISGNYILYVYRNGDPEEKVFESRFCIFNRTTEIEPIVRPGQNTVSRSFQQLNFALFYGNADIPDPLTSIHAVISQNNRWDGVRSNLMPTRHDTYRKRMEYVFYNNEASFPAGNEYRFVDFTSANYPGQNTDYLDRAKKPMHLYVMPDKPRTFEAYAQYNDLNGGALLENRDYGSAETTGQYLWVHFRLKAQDLANRKIWVAGAWSDWQRDDQYLLQRNGDFFEASVLLKQGFYNYMYLTDSKEELEYEIEGNHTETENMYQIFVYNRQFSSGADWLIGYTRFNLNQR